MLLNEIYDIISEAEEKQSNRSLISYITSNLQRVAQSKDSDPRKMLLLVAAISMIGIDDDAAKDAARKLAQMQVSKK